jgi:tRNA threonylcarbamoyladenosine biosynthesis protein TsaB
MGLILNLETATQICSVCLAKDGKLLDIRELDQKNMHAEVINTFIIELIASADVGFKDIDAVAVSMGPGSYTGLRIGVSTAKGLCYALDKPLISVATLDSLAQLALKVLANKIRSNDLLFPMIDARRMEVYTCPFNADAAPLEGVKPLVLNSNSFSNFTEYGKIFLFGDGSFKAKEMFSQNNSIEIYENINASAGGMVKLSENKLSKGVFEDLAYFEPFYLKEFIPGKPNVKDQVFSFPI